MRTVLSEGKPNTRRMNRLIMRPGILPERYRFPSAAPRLAGELLVRVDRHRACHPLEERQIVMGVAVAGAGLEAVQPVAEAGEPLAEAQQLAVAKARRARH